MGEVARSCWIRGGIKNIYRPEWRSRVIIWARLNVDDLWARSKKKVRSLFGEQFCSAEYLILIPVLILFIELRLKREEVFLGVNVCFLG